ncbi:hypothetical protein [Streptomyces sp. NPDC059928]|uniref:hypothetical protein n=1 Tax=unclassified Streptomyces TaxID=2593676 RepID=UPI0036564271
MTSLEPFIHRAALRTLPLITTVVALALASTACSSDSDAPAAKSPASHSSSTTPKPAAPALSKTEALDVITRYSQTNNKATAAYDKAMLATIETGPQLAQSLSTYKQEQGLAEADRTKFEPWAYDTSTAQLYIPKFTEGDKRWFAATVYAGINKKYARYLVFAENPGQHRWELTATIDLDNGQAPPIALDADGNATAVRAPADALRSAVTDNFATGGTGDGKKNLADTPASRRQIEVHQKVGARLEPRGKTVFKAGENTYPDSYALKTTDGGSLIVFAHQHTQTDAPVEPGAAIQPDKLERAWLGDKPLASVTYTFTCNDLAQVPASGSPASLLSYTCARTDAQGPAQRV